MTAVDPCTTHRWITRSFATDECAQCGMMRSREVCGPWLPPAPANAEHASGFTFSRTALPAAPLDAPAHTESNQARLRRLLREEHMPNPHLHSYARETDRGTLACPCGGAEIKKEFMQACRSEGTLMERATILADECGALRSENDDLLRENAMLRRKVEKLERNR